MSHFHECTNSTLFQTPSPIPLKCTYQYLFPIKSIHLVLPPLPQRTVCTLVKMLTFMDGPYIV